MRYCTRLSYFGLMLLLSACNRPAQETSGDAAEMAGDLPVWPQSSWSWGGAREGAVESFNFEFLADGTYNFRSERCGPGGPGQSQEGLWWDRVDDETIKLEVPPDVDQYFSSSTEELFLKLDPGSCRFAHLDSSNPPSTVAGASDFRLELGETCVDPQAGCFADVALITCLEVESCPGA